MIVTTIRIMIINDNIFNNNQMVSMTIVRMKIIIMMIGNDKKIMLN